MRNMITTLAAALVFALAASADDRPVSVAQLPAPAQKFIQEYYPGEKVSYATKDDDIIFPEYNVVLVNGVKIGFNNNGQLDNIEARHSSVPDALIPVQIREYVKIHYPDAVIRSYDVDKRSYEVKLSNRMELKFNRNFQLIEIDD